MGDTRKWKIGVTTAPRPREKLFLLQTLASVEQAGWDEVTVFSEPGVINGITLTAGVQVVQREETLGVYRNWRQALDELVAEEACFYALLQDDQIVRPGLREYLERTIVQEGVYTPYMARKEFVDGPDGWYELHSGWSFCGALFLAMTRKTALSIAEELPAKVPENKHIDAHLAVKLQALGLPLFAHRPTLSQHLADDYSTAGYIQDPFCRMGHGYVDEVIK